jgi:hypothetical protein
MKPRTDMYGKNIVPGPGSYQVAEPGGKNFKFGSSARPNRLGDVPGPGSYESAANLGGANHVKPSFSRNPRNMHGKSDIPGPGAYDALSKSMD